MKWRWITFIVVVVVSFAVLGWSGFQIYQEKPPIPSAVVTSDGSPVMTANDINVGQEVWRAMGGMQLGSVWGHGSYVAPDWTADWLHRECIFILEAWARSAHSREYAALGSEDQAVLRTRLTELMRTNTYDPGTGRVVIDPVRARAFTALRDHYATVFREGHAEYAIPAGALRDEQKLTSLACFYCWTAWAASTERPGQSMTYTSNWPHEPLIRNVPTSDALIWTGLSIMMLLAGIGVLVAYHGAMGAESPAAEVPEEDPLTRAQATPSQKAIVKYFWVVSGMFLVQMVMGVVSAHYGVEGQGFYGIPLAEWLPYSVTRTWHVQLAIFWIATAWLAAGLFIGPSVLGHDPKGQRLGVNILFVALVVVVVGSLTGQWLSIHHMLPGDAWFYFGHQGYEYVDLGRVWQIALLAGLVLWLYLVARCILPVIRQSGEQKSLLAMFLIASAAITLFYAAGLMWGKQTHLSIAEYWRWWVVHLWVEGFFEVFATVVIAFLFSRLGLIRLGTASASVIFSTAIFLTGGIIGTLHHLYFSGTPISVMALGAVFSALEVVPLTIVGFEAWENIRLARATPWMKKYQWPIYFLVAVAFWNMVGAGLFGFMINPPIALYYMQGLNTTPVHGHTALFGVYGMLGIGLMLFCLRVLYVRRDWKDGIIKFAFWTINAGLSLMVGLSLLPIGFMQTWASVEHGYWYARSAELLYSPTVTIFKWLRAPGDTVFAIGILSLVLFVFGLATGHTLRRTSSTSPAEH